MIGGKRADVVDERVIGKTRMTDWAIKTEGTWFLADPQNDDDASSFFPSKRGFQSGFLPSFRIFQCPDACFPR